MPHCFFVCQTNQIQSRRVDKVANELVTTVLVTHLGQYHLVQRDGAESVAKCLSGPKRSREQRYLGYSVFGSVYIPGTPIQFKLDLQAA